jgi:hypothetical protein
MRAREEVARWKDWIGRYRGHMRWLNVGVYLEAARKLSG